MEWASAGLALPVKIVSSSYRFGMAGSSEKSEIRNQTSDSIVPQRGGNKQIKRIRVAVGALMFLKHFGIGRPIPWGAARRSGGRLGFPLRQPGHAGLGGGLFGLLLVA